MDNYWEPIPRLPISGERDHPVERIPISEVREELFNTDRYSIRSGYIDFTHFHYPDDESVFARIMLSPGEYVNLIPCYIKTPNGNNRAGWFNLNSLLYTDNNGIPLYPKYYSILNIQERVRSLMHDDHFVIQSINRHHEDAYKEEIKSKADELNYSIDALKMQPFTLSKSLCGLSSLNKRVILPNDGKLPTILTGISLLRLLLTYDNNPAQFKKLFNIQSRMPLVEFLRLILGKSTIGIYYDRENYTFSVETNMGNGELDSATACLRKELFAEMRSLKNTRPEDRFPEDFKSIVYETYFRDFK